MDVSSEEEWRRPRSKRKAHYLDEDYEEEDEDEDEDEDDDADDSQEITATSDFEVL